MPPALTPIATRVTQVTLIAYALSRVLGAPPGALANAPPGSTRLQGEARQLQGSCKAGPQAVSPPIACASFSSLTSMEPGAKNSRLVERRAAGANDFRARRSAKRAA